MLVKNPISMDARVKGEAIALRNAGHEVTVIGIWKPGFRRDEVHAGVRFHRICLNFHLYGATQPLRRLGTRLRDVVFQLRFRSDGSFADRYRPKFSAEYAPARRKKGTWLRRLSKRLKEVQEERKFLRAATEQSFDVIHAHDLEMLDIAWKAAQQQNAKLVYDSHELWLELNSQHAGRPSFELDRWRTAESSIAPRADLVITVCKGIAEELARLYQLPETPLVVRNCADVSDARDPQNYLREAFLHTSRERAIVLYQGRISVGRGLKLFVEVARLLPHVDFVVIGPQAHGKFARSLVRQAGTISNLFLLAPVAYEELWKVTASADLGFICIEPVCKSYDQAMTNKLFQSMSAGLPFVASDTAGHRELANELPITDRDCMKIIPYHDPEGAATIIDRLLHDRVALRELGARWRVIAARQFNRRLEMQKLVDAYRELESRPASINKAA